MRFEYRLVAEWPPLAWLARWQKTGDAITVQHGRRVETNADWFCEAVWAGDYASGDFDLTDIVAGSGGRIRNDTAVYVSSGSTVDRLVSIQIDDSERLDITGNYSRTICCRIVEEAGVSRELFGQSKAATTVPFREILTHVSMRDYLSWIKKRRWEWLKHGRVPPVPSEEFEGRLLKAMKGPQIRKLRSLLARLPVLWRVNIDKYPDLDKPTPLRRHLFPWALEIEKAKYKNGLKEIV